MATKSSRRDYLMQYLSQGLIDHPIEGQEKVISLLNSWVDDKKDGKANFPNE